MENALAIQTVNTTDLILNTQSFQQVMLVAEMMAAGRATIPRHLQGNKADCAAIVMQSLQWRMNPYAVAQKTHLVNGVLGYEAQLVNAVITSMAPIKGRLQFEWFGSWEKVIGKVREVTSTSKKDDAGEPKKYLKPAWGFTDEEGLGIEVSGTLHGEEKPRALRLLLKQAATRNSTLWAEDPKQQLAYLAIKRWSRLYCPDVIMGVYSADELEEPEKEINPTPPTPIRPTVVSPVSTKPAPPVAEAEYEVVDMAGDGSEAPAHDTRTEAQGDLLADPGEEEPKVLASPNMLKIVSVKLTNAGIPESDLLEMMGIGALSEMEARHVNGATKWIADEAKRRESK